MFDSLRRLRQPIAAGRLSKVVAQSADGLLDWASLEHIIKKIQAELGVQSPVFVLINQTRADQLLAALIASWRAGKVPVMSTTPRLPGISLDIDQDAWNHANLLQPIELPCSVVEDMALVLYTSGSSGAPIAVCKRFSQLDAEIELFEKLWGNLVGNATFMSTVSRQHLYGLSFALLWPLQRGNPIWIDTVHFFQQLESQAENLDMILVTSPVQLEYLPVHLDKTRISRRLRMILSAGAPLAERAARECAEELITVTEIYGSTETGAVAWRRYPYSQQWQTLPGITSRAAGELLQISSSCLESEQWETLSDRVRFDQTGNFELLGRADRIVKVGGKRLSLTEIDHLLCRHPWVDQARTLMLEQRKSRISAVVALNAEGRARLIDQGRRHINRQLSAYLGQYVQTVAVPRYWRYLQKMPVDSQGKIQEYVLSSLFFSKLQPRLPMVLTQKNNGQSSQLDLEIPHHLFYFGGHFPGNPVLPGVVQIDWVRHFGCQVFGELGQFQCLKVLKFQHIIQPGMRLRLSLEWDPERLQLQFCFSNDQHHFSSGRLCFNLQ